MKFRSRHFFTPSTARLAVGAAQFFRRGTPVRDRHVERYVYPHGRLIAAPIPKVASRSMQAMFRALEGGDATFELACGPDELRAQYPDHFIFSFVRNPWARAYSCWKDKIADARSPGKLLILSRFDGLRPFMPFAEFVDWLCSPAGGDPTADRHWLSQSSHLTLAHGGELCDFIGRIESFDVGLDEIGRRTGTALPRVAARNVKGGRRDYVAAYDIATRRRVAERYGEDIERYGYVFE